MEQEKPHSWGQTEVMNLVSDYVNRIYPPKEQHNLAWWFYIIIRFNFHYEWIIFPFYYSDFGISSQAAFLLFSVCYSVSHDANSEPTKSNKELLYFTQNTRLAVLYFTSLGILLLVPCESFLSILFDYDVAFYSHKNSYIMCLA